MAAPILWPDVEAWAVACLTTALGTVPPWWAHTTAGVEVRNRIPTERDEDPWPTSGRLVVVRDDGGGVLGDVRATARLGVQVWAPDQPDATDLAAIVAALLGGAEGSGPVRRATVARAVTVTDEGGRAKRYLTAELVIRGDVLAQSNPVRTP